MKNPSSLEELIEALRCLPGVGPNEVVIYEIELIDIVPEAQE